MRRRRVDQLEDVLTADDGVARDFYRFVFTPFAQGYTAPNSVPKIWDIRRQKRSNEMQKQVSMQQLSAMQGAPVYDDAGDRIGSVEEIFYDTQMNEPAWVGIGTGFLGTKRVLVPVEGARVEGDGVYVPYPKDKVKDSPDIDSDEIDRETENELYAYYGLTGGGSGTEATGESDASMTRSEEELRVGKRATETGQARLRKWVETEPVSEDVELRQERATVTRERIDQPVSGAEIGEQEVDVTLRGEEPVVDKQTVAKERVGLTKDVEVEEETVTGEVRKERVEVEGDADQR
jgi:stress response protein YsnF/sporulation protein YlmC with PRC-barrel domain